MVLGLRSLIPDHWFCFVDLEAQVVDPGFWFPGPESLDPSPGSWVADFRSLVLVRSAIITKCDKKLLQSLTENY